GEVRTVDIAKGNSFFAGVSHIASYAEKITNELRAESFLQGSDADQFSERAAYFLAEWNALHPFREGNGRATRHLVGQLADEAGYSIRWQGMDRVSYLNASIDSFHGNLEPLTGLIRENLHSHAREHERGTGGLF